MQPVPRPGMDELLKIKNILCNMIQLVILQMWHIIIPLYFYEGILLFYCIKPLIAARWRLVNYFFRTFYVPEQKLYVFQLCIIIQNNCFYFNTNHISGPPMMDI